MKEMLSLLKDHGYRQASLAVQKANYAVRMYRSVGFEITDENEEEYIMVYRLGENKALSTMAGCSLISQDEAKKNEISYIWK